MAQLIGFDVDDFIFPFREMLVRSLNMRFGLDLKFENYDTITLDSWLKAHHPEVSALLQREGGRYKHFRWISTDTQLLVET